jgi:transposase
MGAGRRDPSLKAFAQGLIKRGKPPKVAIVAVMRKLIEAANLVLCRGQPWIRQPAN